MRLSYFHVCLILVPLQMVAQNRITDSLNSVLDTARNERRVKTLNELFRAWLPSDPVKAIGFTREALNLAIEINDKRGVAAAYNNLGVAYRNQGALDKALQYYINALRLYEELGNKEGIAGTKSNIATIYSIKKDYGLALKYYEESYATFSELNDKPKIIASMNNLGNLNSDMQLYEKAMKYFSEAWQLSLQIGKPFADPLINIGNVYFRQGNYQRAIENYLKALELERQNNNRLSMLNIFANIGIAYTKAGQPKAAQPYLDEAEKLARELQAYTSLPELLRSKAINQYRIGNLKEAFEIMLRYDSVRERIFGEESSRAISRMELALALNEKEKEFEMLKKQAEINALQLRNSRLFIVLMILGLLVVIAGVNFYFMNKRKALIKP
jgi:tetratricopeptide (TPR) repeat protein